MVFNIRNFKENGLTLGGARPTLFQVELQTLPIALAGVNNDSYDKFVFTCRAANLPPATINSVDVGYFGRKIKVAGDRTFNDWSITVINDEDFLVRSMFEYWSNSMNTLESNVRNVVEGDYKADMVVRQYAKTGEEIRAYRVVGAFPTSVDAIGLDWDNQNQIETFTVGLAYDYWLPETELDNGYLGEAVAGPF